ncbi:MAG: porphobilinogen synthase [Coriobacteriia bacterium]|nr:porphobilinogen synthase [Coriobacteriia bacterium]
MTTPQPTRHRRLRANPTIRAMLRETHLTRADLIYPVFIHAGDQPTIPIPSMPGVSRLSLAAFEQALLGLADLGIPALLLFGLPAHKDALGSQAADPNGIVQQAIRLAKRSHPNLYLISDVCLCAYTDHGHCGLFDANQQLDNDKSVAQLAQVALSHAQAGVDMVAPSDMMDGRVRAIRTALDSEGFQDTPIMSYASKYASAFYGPFRDAADSAPQFGDRRSYQMDPANSDEALREILTDVAEGADLILVKPALAYGDIIYRARQAAGVPIAAYNVSGEYAMLKLAAQQGLIDEKQAILETLIGFKRAGADLIVTYHAPQVAPWLPA